MINLIPSSLKQQRKYGRRNGILLGYSVVLLLAAIGVAGVLTLSHQLMTNTQANLQNEIDDITTQQIEPLRGEVVEIENVATRFETAQQLQEQSVKFSELLPNIAAALPQGVVLNALSLNGGISDPLALDVSLTSADLAPILLRNIVESDLFEAADIASLTPTGGGDENTTGEDGEQVERVQYRFNAQVTASFAGTAEAERKAKAAAAAAAQTAAEQATEGTE